jgi:ribosomal protein S18 acetylase RimI-like enzyme
MVVKEVGEDLFPSAQEYLERDPLANVYPLSNLVSRNDKSRFFVRLVENSGRVDGLLMIIKGFRRPSAWLIADSDQTVRELSTNLQFSSGRIWTKPEKEQILNEISQSEFSPWKIKSRMIFDQMVLDFSKLNLRTSHDWRRLTEEDAEEWTRANWIMDFDEHSLGKLDNKSDALSVHHELYARKPSSEDLASARDFLRKTPSFGIIENGILAARSAFEELDGIAIAIRRIYTRPEYRGRGYGLAITSVAVQEAMKQGPGKPVILFVLRDNAQAKRIYQKIGFRMIAERVELQVEPSNPNTS